MTHLQTVMPLYVTANHSFRLILAVLKRACKINDLPVADGDKGSYLYPNPHLPFGLQKKEKAIL